MNTAHRVRVSALHCGMVVAVHCGFASVRREMKCKTEKIAPMEPVKATQEGSGLA